MWQFAVDELEVISSVTCASSEAQTARRWTLGPIILSEPTGERLNIALVAQLEGPAAMSMHDSPSLPACIALLDALAHSFHRVFSGSLHRRISAVINVF